MSNINSVSRWLFSCIVLLSGIGTVPSWGQSGDGNPSSTGAAGPDSAAAWTYDATARLNASQAAFKDWEEGGSNSLAFSAGIGGGAKQRGETWIQAYDAEFLLGIINQEGQELRKSEDQIRLSSNLRYKGEGFFKLFNPTLSSKLRTQFAKGFDYTDNPFEGEVDEGDPRLEETPPVLTSNFFAPAFITQALGLTYEPIRDFTIQIGAASKQTVVIEEEVRVLYGVDEDEPTRIEAGGQLSSKFDRQLTENIRYQSQLNVFFSFNQTEEPPDARWNNTLSLQVNDWLSTDLTFVGLFDQDISDVFQMKETISVGISFSLL